MEPISLNTFYEATLGLIPDGINKEIGHFNLFEISEVRAQLKRKHSVTMPYNRC